MAAALAVLLTSCPRPEPELTKNETTTAMRENPFITESPLPFEYPQFDRIDEKHYRPAFEQGMARHLDQVNAIADQAEPPTFENTLAALERSGRMLRRVRSVFFNLVAAHTNDKLEEIRSEMAPKLSAHRDRILLNPKLFERVRDLYGRRQTLNIDDESRRLIQEYYIDFVRAGARLSDPDKARLQEINVELASLQTRFSQNLLSEVNASAVVVTEREELDGLSENEIEAAADAAAARGLKGKFLVALRNTSGQPPLTWIRDRAMRKRIMKASQARGSRGGEFDNRGIVARSAKLRAERSALLGYPNHAAYSLERQTAKTVEAVNRFLSQLASAAAANASREARELQAVIDGGGESHPLAAWDWAYYAEKVRRKRYAFDAAQLRPYFEIGNVLQKGVFYAANRLYGMSLRERTDLPAHHPDVRVFDVLDAGARPLALFLVDLYARPSKQGGAWMSSFVSQSELLGTRPVVANYMNVPKPPAGEPTLLTLDEVETLFHEFGHALHAIFSSVRYPYFSGTSVPRDFVEFPSQINEMWATWPEVVKNYAVHYRTGEPMPMELVGKMLAAERFNQGFATTEYLAASLLDQAWHQLTAQEVPGAEGVTDFEKTVLSKAGVAFDAVPPRYRSTYFSHIWSGGYSAGYYSYIWSEVLDADTVEWFKEEGGLTRENGDRFRRMILSKGGSREAMSLYRDFRGRDPDPASLLARRGLN